MEGLINNRQFNMYKKLKDSINKANKIYFNVSFIRDSGVKLIIDDLKNAIENGKEVKILTSDYMNITEPNALYRLANIKNNKVRIFNNKNNISFHPKVYIFEYNDDAEVIIGSSNISYSALTNGIEWNYSFKKNSNPDDFKKFMNEYFELYEKNSFELSLKWLRSYEKSFIKKDVYFDNEIPEKTLNRLEPIKFQIPALYELSKTREEGYKKAMVIVATGLGKTFLAAFDTLNSKKILFIAHRKEILTQAKKTFKAVHKNKSMGFFNSENKDTMSDIIFASIDTLGKETYLNENYFQKNYFDYIVVDEFHHSGANIYEKVLKYFDPKFLLGLTATPDRMDNKDIYKWCDYNIAYECNFKTGINNGWLVPFDYYAIYDEIDFQEIPWRNGKYDLEILENKLLVDKRAQQIFDNYKIYSKNKTIGFCASKNHCIFMDDFFKKRNIHSSYITSETKNRDQIIENFKNGKLDIIFTVDIFNEGVDIPDIDTVMFLRPTNSYTIFVQQLGRGLRTSKNKTKLTVLDFVGNYRGSELRPLFLTGEYTPRDLKKRSHLPTDKNLPLPEGCNVNIDLKLIEYFKEANLKSSSLKERLEFEYFRIKDDLKKVPSLMEMYSESVYPVSVYINQFKGWLNFLESIGELNDLQTEWQNNTVSSFLFELEKTSMTKSYKIPTLMSFLKKDILFENVSTLDIAENFKNFYSDTLHGKDLNNKKHENWQYWELKDFEKLAIENPIKFLSKSEFFHYNETTKIFSIKKNIYSHLNKYNLVKEIKDRLDYRNICYFHRKYGDEE